MLLLVRSCKFLMPSGNCISVPLLMEMTIPSDAMGQTIGSKSHRLSFMKSHLSAIHEDLVVNVAGVCINTLLLAGYIV